MRTALVVIALLGVAVLVWMSGREDDPAADAMGRTTDSASGNPGRDATAPRDEGAPESAPAIAGRPLADRRRPALPEATGGSLPLAERPLFDEVGAEARDPAWASATEAAIRERIESLLDGRAQPTVPQLECRETVCRMLVASGDQGDLRRFMAELNSRRGFVGDAKMLAFEDVESRADAEGETYHAVRVMLVYAR